MSFFVGCTKTEVLTAHLAATDQVRKLIAGFNPAGPRVGMLVDAYLVQLRRVNSIESVGHTPYLDRTAILDDRAGGPALARGENCQYQDKTTHRAAVARREFVTAFLAYRTDFALPKMLRQRVRKRGCEFGPGGIRPYSMASDSDTVLRRGTQVSLRLREVGSWARREQLHAVVFDRLLQASRLGVARNKTQDGCVSTFGRVKDTGASGRFIETVYQRVVQRFGEKEEPHLTAQRLQGGNCGDIAIRAKNRTSALQQFRYALVEFKAPAMAASPPATAVSGTFHRGWLAAAGFTGKRRANA